MNRGTAVASSRARSSWLATAFFVGAALWWMPSSARAAITAIGDVLPNPPQQSEPVDIGLQAIGRLTIDGGSLLESNGVGIGYEGFGFATVTGIGSQWKILGGMEVGGYGVGRLEVRDGGYVSTDFEVTLGDGPGSNGAVLVDGLGSIFQVEGRLDVGVQGVGLLKISNEAIVQAGDEETFVGPLGRVELRGGLLRTQRLHNAGAIVGSGTIQFLQNADQVLNSGRIEVSAGDHLSFLTSNNWPLQNSGVIASDGGEIEFQSAVRIQGFGNLPSPEITLRNGVMRFPNPEFSSLDGLVLEGGILAAIGGQNDFYGTLSQPSFGGSPKTLITNDSVMVFHDPVYIDQGDFIVHPGSAAIFLDDFYMNGVLQLTVGAGAATIPLQVGGGASLGGQIDVQLAGGYAPQAGDAFTLVTGGQIDGTLLPIDMPDLPVGLAWDWNYSQTQLELAVVAGLLGDYNGNGIVDAADYGMWRDTLEAGSTELTNDPTPGAVDESDFDYWRAHFGETFNSGAGIAKAAVVPEPATMTLLCLGLLLARRIASRRGSV